MAAQEPLLIAASALTLFFVVKALVHILLRKQRPEVEHHTPSGRASDTLVVMAHGMAGRRSFEGAVHLASQALPHGDRLVLRFDARFIANADAFDIANLLEQAIHEAVGSHGYRHIVLLGHSAGGALVRKAFVWGHGLEDDRTRLGARGKRPWVDRVERIVLLAGINRGWTISPPPAKMHWAVIAGLWLSVALSRALNVGRFPLQMRRGEPFIADTRVQWIRLSRSEAVVSGIQPFPQLIQLIGSEDDIVSKEDGQDLMTGRGSFFRTLAQTGHREIGVSLDNPKAPGATLRLHKIAQALQGDLLGLEPDKIDLPPEDRVVTRIVYVMHGIRDYGDWTDVVRKAVEARCAAEGVRAKVVNLKYGYFPLLPFITFRDRQKNVRRFMDDYTENLARYPNTESVDFVGHSNGTYILASALVRYRTLRVRRVFFAGSVVPKHYPWQAHVDEGRVGTVANVVATTDWVVAIFPKVFEQIADWLGRTPTMGWLDIGAAGFRGFLHAGGAGTAVRDFKYAKGAHSTGVEVAVPAKLQAIVSYVLDGDTAGLASFTSEARPAPWLSVVSNVSYVVWIGLAAAVVAGAWAAAALGWVALVIYALAILALLHSI